MTAAQFVGLFCHPCHTTSGWMVCCPAHADRSPSLHITEGADGRVLIHCFAGCSSDNICRALDLRVSDLFVTAKQGSHGRRPGSPNDQIAVCNWREIASALEDHAMALHLRAESVFRAAMRAYSVAWTDEKTERAMAAIARAHQDQERADLLEEVAYQVRLRGLEKEKHNVR